MKTLLAAVAVVGCTFGASAQLVTDFESYAAGSSVMFRQPTFSGSTSSLLDTTGYNFAGLTNAFPAGNVNAGSTVFNTMFTFKADLATPWLRLTSNGSPNLPNPAISFKNGLSFDIYVDRPIYVALLLRETNTTEPIGGNAGTTGGIEFVGGVPSSATASKGQLVPANTWTTIWFNIPESSVAAFAGSTANGVLESTTGKGALEALGFSVDANTSGTFNVYMDNFQVIPEPSTAALVGLGALAFLARRRQNA